MSRKNDFNETNDEYLLVDCDIAVTITRRAKLKVYEAEVMEDYEDEVYQRDIDLSNVDWQETLEDNSLIPEGWNVEEVNVEPIQW